MTPKGRTVMSTMFVRSAGAILVIVGAAKIWTAVSHTKITTAADPIIGAPIAHVLMAVGILELLVGGVCWFGRAQKLAVGLVAWLATCFFIYRIGLEWVGWKKPCGCMGNLTDVLHLQPQTADQVIKMILAYLLIGSYGCLCSMWTQKCKILRLSGEHLAQKGQTTLQ